MIGQSVRVHRILAAALVAVCAVAGLRPARAAVGSTMGAQRPAPTRMKISAFLADRSLISQDLASRMFLDRSVIRDIIAPPILDYSGEALFIRTQDGWGGCPGMTLLHITDILKDWEHPYTPDLSFLGVDEINANRIIADGNAGKTEASNLAYTTFTEHGLPSEARYHSNYDNLTPRIMQSDTALWDPGDGVGWNEDLSDTARKEARLYRVKLGPMQSVNAADANPVTVDDIKALLARYGPIYAGGWWRQINGSKDEGHVMTIVGYDDTTQTLKYLNSWGTGFTHGTSEPSCGLLPYDKLYEESPGNPNIQAIQYLTNIPSLRHETPDAYTARLRIPHPWRGTINVKVGVEGQPLMTVWDTRARNPQRRDENCSDLTLDVPLPNYASKYWPPSGAHRWVLRVEDCDRDGRTGSIAQFTLARLYLKPHCLSLGRFSTQVFGGPANLAVPDPTTGQQWSPVADAMPVTPNPNPGVAQLFVPAAKTNGPVLTASSAAVAAMLAYQVKLPADLASVEGSDLKLTAVLRQYSPKTGKWAPVAGKTVGFFELVQIACVNKPSQWKSLGSAKTGASGRARLAVPGGLAKHVYAAAFKNDQGEVLTSSFPLTYDNTAQLRPVIEYAKPDLEMVFPDLNLPRPPVEQLEDRAKTMRPAMPAY